MTEYQRGYLAGIAAGIAKEKRDRGIKRSAQARRYYLKHQERERAKRRERARIRRAMLKVAA